MSIIVDLTLRVTAIAKRHNDSPQYSAGPEAAVANTLAAQRGLVLLKLLSEL